MRDFFRKNNFTFGFSMMVALLILCFSFFATSFVFSTAVDAQAPQGPSRQLEGKGNWWFPTYDEFLDKVNLAPPNEIFGERYTHAQVSWVVNSILNIVVGPIAACAEEQDPGKCMEEALSNNAGVILPLAVVGDSIFHTKPVSGIDYLAEKANRLGIVGEAYAQNTTEGGFGYSTSLIFARNLWVVVRNAAYSLVVLAILFLGFMVMFRAQIAPRTAITVQSAIPRVIIGLLLITFSYAIAGFMVDLIYILLGLTSGIISQSSLTQMPAVDIFDRLNNVNGSMSSLVLALFVGLFAGVLAVGGVSGAAAGLVLGGTAIASIGWFVAGFILIIILLVAIVVLIALIRVFWEMLKAYTIVILLVIASPFVFLYGMVKDGVNGIWFRTVFSYLSVFYTIPLMILIANIIIFTTMNDGLVQTIASIAATLISFGGTPNFYEIKTGVTDSGGQMPGFGTGGGSLLGVLIALTLFVSLPSFAKAISGYIRGERADFSPTWGAALGGALGAGAVNMATSRQREWADVKQQEAHRINAPVHRYLSGRALHGYRATRALQFLTGLISRR